VALQKITVHLFKHTIMGKGNLTKNLLELNLAMLFISTSGVLGRYIDMPSPITIGLRALLACLVLFLFCKWKKVNLHLQPKDRKTILASGILLGLHWTTYFYALQLSNVAIGMLSLFTYPAITAILEPILLKTKILKVHILLSILVLVGIYFLVPDFDLQNNQFKAVGFGVLSAFCYALRNIAMKSKIDQYDGSALMVYQLLAIAVFWSPFFFLLDSSKVLTYLPATILLAVLTTSIGHTLFLYSLKNFSTITASIISCTQPIYGILIGLIILGEVPKLTTLIGGLIIISTVLAESIRLSRLEKQTVQ
jgi:drug/metabolite transporter (DMT)-like permease